MAGGGGTGLTRRGLLGVGAGLLLGSVGCTGPGVDLPGESATCVPRDSLDEHRTLAGAPLHYEINGRRSAFRFNSDFHAQLERWAEELAGQLGSAVERWSTYGTWTNGGAACGSWHNSGRAFDLASVRLADGSTATCRYDLWRSTSSSDMVSTRRRYWRVAASLHAQFAYVLTYLYNADHANHIHVDNGRSGPEPATFTGRSRVQVQAVQAICSYLWDEPVELTGTWDRATRRASRRVLERIEFADALDADGAWAAFMNASAQRGRG